MASKAHDFYFSRFEGRAAPATKQPNPLIMGLWQFTAICTLVFGGWYLFWRWTESIDPNALWFSLPMAVAETLSWFGLMLMIYNLWDVRDYPQSRPPMRIGECERQPIDPNRGITVDVFICTYSEDEELVRLSIRDAMAVRCPPGVTHKVHVLDDGSRALMRDVAIMEGANYITRATNVGYKAGNLRNGMDMTRGDFIAICDADTRLFPAFLEETLGYFRDPDVAFVQTPQWFYDLPEGETLEENWRRRFGRAAGSVAKAIERVFGQIRIDADPFVNDALIFYDIIQRRRNRANAAFCCGAASIHRREAVMAVALRAWSEAVGRASSQKSPGLLARLWGKGSGDDVDLLERWQAAQSLELTPYKFHVSEDLYSTIVLHQDRVRRWKSVMHPTILSKMLSPQDLLTWTIQRFKYAGGSVDIFFNDNPIFRPGLSFGQRLMYLSTFWSYMSSIWGLMFIAAPIIYLYTGIGPVKSYSREFFFHLLPFLVSLELAMMFGHWGQSGHVSKVMSLASFNISLQAIWTVLRGKKISFPVTPKARQEGNFSALVWPHRTIIWLNNVGMVFALAMLYFNNIGVVSTGHTVGGMIANSVFVVYNNMAFGKMLKAARWRPPVDR